MKDTDVTAHWYKKYTYYIKTCCGIHNASDEVKTTNNILKADIVSAFHKYIKYANYIAVFTTFMFAWACTDIIQFTGFFTSLAFWLMIVSIAVSKPYAILSLLDKTKQEHRQVSIMVICVSTIITFTGFVSNCKYLGAEFFTKEFLHIVNFFIPLFPDTYAPDYVYPVIILLGISLEMIKFGVHYFYFESSGFVSQDSNDAKKVTKTKRKSKGIIKSNNKDKAKDKVKTKKIK